MTHIQNRITLLLTQSIITHHSVASIDHLKKLAKQKQKIIEFPMHSFPIYLQHQNEQEKVSGQVSQVYTSNRQSGLHTTCAVHVFCYQMLHN